MAPSSATRIPGEQRVFSLVLALVARPDGATKAELLDTVYGYQSDNRDPRAVVARDRQFERDKAQLRELGIPVETIDSPGEVGNNQLTRYRISKHLLQVPEHVRFSPEELTLLRGAALAWQEGSLTSEARRSVMKLASLDSRSELQHIGVAPQLGIAEPTAPALQRAMAGGLTVSFLYQIPTLDAPLMRTVAPLGLHRADGRWHLIAHDLERDDARVFLLSRIQGEVHISRDAFHEELRRGYDEIVSELTSLETERRAVLEILRGSVAEARITPRASQTLEQNSQTLTIEIGTLDFHVLAAELLQFGSEIRVVDPPQLKEIVHNMLLRVRAQHSQAAAFENGELP